MYILQIIKRMEKTNGTTHLPKLLVPKKLGIGHGNFRKINKVTG